MKSSSSWFTTICLGFSFCNIAKFGQDMGMEVFVKMKTIVTLLTSIYFVVSPLWPLEPNPLVGDPFIIVNKKTNQLGFIHEGKIQSITPVATGKYSSSTPEGIFTIIVKAKNPYYRKLDIRGGSPRNPLGTRWIGFDALETDGRIYGVHGTNKPDSIGKYRSDGCIRMHNRDVEFIYERIPIGTKIIVTTSEKSFEQIARDHGAIN